MSPRKPRRPFASTGRSTSRGWARSALRVPLLAIALGCGTSEAPPPPPPAVVVAPVMRQNVPIESEWVGTLDGFIDAKIQARVSGHLLSRGYLEGTFVKKGDLLFEIDPRTYQAAYEQARGQVGRAEAILRQSNINVARYTPLAKEGAVSQQELDNALQLRDANTANLASARATLEQAKLNLDWTRVISPIDGIAGIAIAQVGDLVQQNTELTTVSQVDPIKVRFPVSEREYIRLATERQNRQPGSAEKVKLTLVLADGSTFAQSGEATFANRQVDPRTGTILIEGAFPNPGNLLRPGQYAKVRAVVNQRSDALLVPQRAVVELQGSQQVAVVGADDKVVMKVVKTGPKVGSLWVIDQGLAPGDRVVVEGVQKVRGGMTVNPTAGGDTPAVAAPDAS